MNFILLREFHWFFLLCHHPETNIFVEHQTSYERLSYGICSGTLVCKDSALSSAMYHAHETSGQRWSSVPTVLGLGSKRVS